MTKQEALNKLSNLAKININPLVYDECICKLQELINNQADYIGYQDLKAEYEGELQELKNQLKFVEEVQTPDYIRVQNLNEQLEKALDIASEYLYRYMPICSMNSVERKARTKEQWKDYLLNKAKEELNGK